jgi:hypothetical protein
MSDEAACFVKVAEDLGCQHALDRKHLNQQIVPAMEGMHENEKPAFKHHIYQILNATSTEEVEIFLHVALATQKLLDSFRRSTSKQSNAYEIDNRRR